MRRTIRRLAPFVSMLASLACSESGNDLFGPGGSAGATTGGTAGSGGAGMIGGTAGAAGTAGQAGGGAPGGSSAGGGMAGSGPGGAGTGGGPPVGCTITATSTVSEEIPTVGIVTWSTDFAGITEARIEFGLTTEYGTDAPVRLSQPDYRTFLIGLKAERLYHFRVVARGVPGECTSSDYTLTTGALSDDLPEVTVTTNDASSLAGGYLVGSFTRTNGGAFILDADGDYVWWFAAGAASRAAMSSSGEHLWLLSTNQAGGNPNVRRVGIDGTGLEMHPEFGDAHHDFVVLPDESVGFLQYTEGRDRVMERAADGTVRQIVDVPTAHGGVTNNHSNSIQYYAPDDSYTFSDLDQNCYVKVSRQGQVAWVLGGDTSDFTGPGATWNREHGHHLLAPNRLLFFNNGSQGADSIMREVTLDTTAGTASITWQYDGNENSSTLGDVQRLWNGNTLATYSNANTLHEVNASGELVQSISFASNPGLGYVMKRQSLYGPPPKQGSPPHP